MARREREEEEAGMPAWMVTFSDLMTLLLTFFVLLVSMATIDEQRRLEVLSTVTGAFGFATSTSNPLGRSLTNAVVAEGPMEAADTPADLEMVKDVLWQEVGRDINFLSNKYVQILSLTEDVLFKRGSSELSPEGKRILNKMLPVLKRLEYPLLIGGHTSSMRDEAGEDFLQINRDDKLSPSWALALGRSAAIYDYLKEEGVPAEKLSIEAFGEYRPRYSDKTERDRRANRRVDLVIDKRNPVADISLLNRAREPRQKEPASYKYREFIFELPEREQR